MPEPENTDMCNYAYFRVFWFGHFPRSGVESESSFLIKYYIITVLNFFLERFGQYLKKSKNGFPIVFSNLARPMGGGNFRDTILVIQSF